jgi:hypothetical protein
MPAEAEVVAGSGAAAQASMSEYAGRTVKITGLNPLATAVSVADALHRAVAMAMPDEKLPDLPPGGDDMRFLPSDAPVDEQEELRSRCLLLSWGCAVQSCKLLATTRDGSEPRAVAVWSASGSRSGNYGGGRGGRDSLRRAGSEPVGSSVLEGSGVEGFATFKSKTFVDWLMRGRASECELRLGNLAVNGMSIR